MQGIALYNKFVCDFYNILNDSNLNYTNLILVCIGTDKMTGDLFGPLVGNKIKDLNNEKYLKMIVYGDLENQVIFSNANQVINKIKYKYEKPCIIAIDSALSKKENIGKIIVKKGGVSYGHALKKKSNEIGDVTVKAIVGINYNHVYKNFKSLENVPLNLIVKLANIVANGITEVVNFCE